MFSGSSEFFVWFAARYLRAFTTRGPQEKLRRELVPHDWLRGLPQLFLPLNPNLIYMQSTAMGESLYLAFFIWAVVFFSEWLRGESKALTKCGLCLAAACLTRYDGWFLAVAMAGVVLLHLFLAGNRAGKSTSSRDRERACDSVFADRSRGSGIFGSLTTPSSTAILWNLRTALIRLKPSNAERRRMERPGTRAAATYFSLECTS